MCHSMPAFPKVLLLSAKMCVVCLSGQSVCGEFHMDIFTAK